MVVDDDGDGGPLEESWALLATVDWRVWTLGERAERNRGLAEIWAGSNFFIFFGFIFIVIIYIIKYPVIN